MSKSDYYVIALYIAHEPFWQGPLSEGQANKLAQRLADSGDYIRIRVVKLIKEVKSKVEL